MSTYTFRVTNIKKPDLPQEIVRSVVDADIDSREDYLEHVRPKLDKYFRHSEYFDLEIEVNDDMEIVGGQILEQ